MTNNLSFLSSISLAPRDPILGIQELYLADKNNNKVNLGVGVYQDISGAVSILDVVREASLRLVQEEKTKSYLPISGLESFVIEAQKLLFGSDAACLKEKRVASVQSIGGTGALRVGMDFLVKAVGAKVIGVSDPSWENHQALALAAGLKVTVYDYYDYKKHGLNFAALCDNLSRLESGSIVLLHGCCHNPSGVDPDSNQWKEIIALIQTRGLIPFIDLAYQGLGAGLREDRFIVDLLLENNMSFVISQSFSKNMSIYRERVGTLSVVCKDEDEAKRTLSQLKLVIRANYSSPSSFGAQVVGSILSNPELRKRWEIEVDTMRNRIKSMRGLLTSRLKEKLPKVDFSFFENQRGMFSFSGLSQAQVIKLREEFSVYLVENGRMCVAALNERNVDHVVNALAEVVESND